MVHIIAACIQKICFVEASYVSTPTSHNSFNSSINGCKYISMSFPGAVGPGIRSDNMKNVCFIHIQGCKLYGIRTTGHMLYEIYIFPKGLNPSLAKPSLEFQGSCANEGCTLSKFFQAKESTGCLIISPLMQLSTCHFM